ncbi:hypothetical protein A9239_14800 [Methanosarcina sp. A14]|nr:hypothetical protein A9239_14800 [Methanosarcina sp. A14]
MESAEITEELCSHFLYSMFSVLSVVTFQFRLMKKFWSLNIKKQVKQRAQVIGMFYGQIMNESKESSNIQKVKFVLRKR